MYVTKSWVYRWGSDAGVGKSFGRFVQGNSGDSPLQDMGKVDQKLEGKTAIALDSYVKLP